jgi:uncharacterized Tic20 family protein
MHSSYETDKRKLLSAACHASIFLSAAVVSIAIPLGILFISDDSVVKENAKEALNFHLNVWLYGVIIGVLSFITLGLAGFVFGPLWLVLHLGLSIWAVYQCLKSPDTAVRYPFIFRPL